MAIKILHCADLHLDSPFDSLPDDKAAKMRSEQRELLLYITDIASSRSADIILMSGDLLDSTVAYYETYEALLNALSRINARVFISPGNHDYFSPTSPYAFIDFPENVHIFKSQEIECVELPELGCRVYGAAFTGPSCASLLNGFEAADDELVNLMVLHGNLMGDSYNRITTENIASSGLDYLALGHVHSYSGILSAGASHYAYPGCAQGRGFDETGEKGVLFGEVSKGAVDLSFIPTASRKYVDLSVSLDDCGDAVSAIDKAVSGQYENDILRVTLTGEYDDQINVPALTQKYADSAFHFILRNRTHSRRDIWEGLSEDTLTGSFLRIMRKKYDSAEDDSQREVIEAAIKYALAALENREEH